MKKAFLTLAAVLTSVLAMSQFYVYKGGHLLYEIENGIADSVTFVKPDYLGFENGYEWVDLGLTSGTRWAAMNVGANKAEDCVSPSSRSSAPVLPRSGPLSSMTKHSVWGTSNLSSVSRFA